MNFPGYLKVGDYYLSSSKADDVKARIEQLLVATDSKRATAATNDSTASPAGASLADVVALIESLGLPTSLNQILDVLGYTVVWDGLDYAKSTVVRSKQVMSPAPKA